MNWLNKLIEKYYAWWTKREIKKQREASLKKFGWDGTCRNCGKYHHGDKAAEFVGETTSTITKYNEAENKFETHTVGEYWHYKCQCGYLNSYNLLMAPLPIADDVGGLKSYMATIGSVKHGR